MVEDEDLLLEVLNSAPITEGRPTDALTGALGEDFAIRQGGTGSAAELAWLRKIRGCLHGMIRGDAGAPSQLADALADVVLTPEVTSEGLDWVLRTTDEKWIAARAALAWSRVVRQLPGRLRPCANSECNLFLLDRSRPGTAKWCSMATCGNRMKARAHATRRRDGPGGREVISQQTAALEARPEGSGSPRS